ncbi:MAG: caspase family protein [Candidatus Pacearchaeota archaeon]|jgi:hypothetical protein
MKKQSPRREFLGLIGKSLAAATFGYCLEESIFKTKKTILTLERLLQKIDYTPIPGKKAILVQQDPTRGDDIKIANYYFKKFGYSIDYIPPNHATEDNIFKKINRIASNEKNNKTIFYYTGHGGRIKNSFIINIDYINGVPPDINKSRITPKEIFREIGKIKGKKAIIIDSCFSGIFPYWIKEHLGRSKLTFKKKIINNFVVISATKEDSISVSSGEYIRGMKVGALTFGLYNLFNSKKGLINISKDEILCGNKEHRENPEKVLRLLKLPKDTKISFDMQRYGDTDFIL